MKIMRTLLIPSILAAFALPMVSLADDHDYEPGTWITNYEQALEFSKEHERPILAFFTGSDWCGFCIRLKENVFTTDTFKDFAKENLILLELDFPREVEQSDELKAQNAALRERFEIRGFPTSIKLNSEGDEIGRIVGYPGTDAEAWVEQFAAIKPEPAQVTETEVVLESVPENWHTNYDKAVALAKEENKQVLVLFTGSDWCPPCRSLKANVFDHEDFKAWANENVILVFLDFPRSIELPESLVAQNRQLAQKYEIRGYPTVILLNADGVELSREVGFGGGTPTEWITNLTEKAASSN